MLKIMPHFSVPIAMSRLSNCDNLNAQLLNHFDGLKKNEKNKNNIPTQPEREDLYESNFDLFKSNFEPLKQLKSIIDDELIGLIMQINQYPEAVKPTLKIKQHAWFHITEKNGYFTNHNHPMASWSAIYCVSSGGRPKDYPESAITRLFHPNPASNCYIDAGNANLQGQFSTGSLNFPLEAGDLVFFPSYLMHEVSVHKGEKSRVTIAANFWIDSEYIKVRV